MRDIALRWDPVTGSADLVMDGPDLAGDATLLTAVIISLFTDRLAESGDDIPDGSTDPRGWWGDEAFEDGAAPAYRIGSRLWLLDRALQTQDTLNRAGNYAREALQWLIDDGVAGSVTATATFPQPGWIELQIVIAQQGGSATFRFAWALLPETVAQGYTPPGHTWLDIAGTWIAASTGT